MASSVPVCPILSVRNTEYNELCLGADCAMYLPAAKKCSLVFIGYRAMLDVQRLQQPPVPKP